MDGGRFDDISRIVAEPTSRRGVFWLMVAGLVVWFVGKPAVRGLVDGEERNFTLSCTDCEHALNEAEAAVNAAYEAGCIATVMSALKCPGTTKLGCGAFAAAACVIAKFGPENGLPDLNSRAICSSNLTGKIPFIMEGAGPPCASQTSCGSGEELCPGTRLCVRRCDEDRQMLNPTTCECDSLPTATKDEHDGRSLSSRMGNTGNASQDRWQFVVPDGQVLVVGAESAQINGLWVGDRWVVAAFDEHTPMDMTIATGFWTVVDKPLAHSFFCGQLSSTAPESLRAPYTFAYGLDEWGSEPCLNGGPKLLSSSDMENTYESPFHGYRAGWDDSWTLQQEHSWWVGGPTGGFDQIQIIRGSNVFALTGTREWNGDTSMCLDMAARGIENDPQLSNVERVWDVDDQPTGNWEDREEAAVFRYLSTYYGGRQERYAYVNCVTLPSGVDTLAILFAAPAAAYASELHVRDELIARVSIPD